MLRMMALTVYALSRNARISALVFELFAMASNSFLTSSSFFSAGIEAIEFSGQSIASFFQFSQFFLAFEYLSIN